MPLNKTVDVHLIDRPEIAMRVDIPDSYIRELADNIAQVGLIHPLAVTKEGQRYRIEDGDCRLFAVKLLGWQMVDVRDFTGEPLALEQLKFSANRHRLDPSDAEIAVYLHDIQVKHHFTIDKLIEITGESEDWINKRLRLFDGDEDVFNALLKKQIILGHALLLNRFPEMYRAQYLQIIINSTPPLRTVEDWLRTCKAMVVNPGQPVAEQTQPAADATPPGVVIDCCQICKGTELVWTMEFIRVHKHCMQMIVDAIAAQAKGA